MDAKWVEAVPECRWNNKYEMKELEMKRDMYYTDEQLVLNIELSRFRPFRRVFYISLFCQEYCVFISLSLKGGWQKANPQTIASLSPVFFVVSIVRDALDAAMNFYTPPPVHTSHAAGPANPPSRQNRVPPHVLEAAMKAMEQVRGSLARCVGARLTSCSHQRRV